MENEKAKLSGAVIENFDFKSKAKYKRKILSTIYNRVPAIIEEMENRGRGARFFTT